MLHGREIAAAGRLGLLVGGAVAVALGVTNIAVGAAAGIVVGALGGAGIEIAAGGVMGATVVTQAESTSPHAMTTIMFNLIFVFLHKKYAYSDNE